MSEAGSFSTGTGGSSSVAGSENTDARALTAMQAGAEGDNEDVGTSSRGLQEAVFSTIYTLTKSRTAETAPRVAALRVVVEWLQLFLVIFNPTFSWNIATNSFMWRAIKWLLVRYMVEQKGYPTYISVFYVMSAIILATIAASVWVAFVLKGDKGGNVWVRRLISALQWAALIVYSVMWPAVLDYIVYLWDCSWGSLAHGEGVYHLSFTDKNCLAMPHLAHMVFAGVMVGIFSAIALLMSVGIYDMNPMTRSILASSDAITTFKIMMTKIAIVLLASSLDDFHRAQLVLMLMLIYGSLYFHIVELPFYGLYINLAWTGLMTGLMLVLCLLLGLQFSVDRKSKANPNFATNMTMGVLYGIVPAVLLGAAVVYVRMGRIKKISTSLHKAFEDRRETAAIGGVSAADGRDAGSSVVALMSDLKSVYRFKDVRQVSMLCRVMRKWDEDGVPDKEACEFGEFILKAAMARIPNHPTLLVMHTNFLVEVRKDGQAARTQLQLAQKGNPAMLDHYNIYLAQQLAKLLKQETGDTLDLMSYIEYQRSYRACVRLHKLALIAQHQFWSSLLRDTILCKDVQRSLEVMEAAEAKATAMYRRVLERYPSNGKLLKVYGRFLEYVRNDPWTAAKYYDEATKLGTTESLLSMTQGSDGLNLAGNINEKVDGLVIINAQGVTMMINKAALLLFGYEKGELEGKNVNLLMPQPFSTHHNLFLQRYLNTGHPHILNKTRQLVALHKDRTMFPLNLFATRLSGIGSDTLFMGVLRRPAPLINENGSTVRFWSTANGTILCADSSVVDSFGYKASELIGQNFTTLCTGNLEQISRFIINFSEQQSEVSAAGVRTQDSIQAQVLHAYLPPVDVDLTLELAGAVDTSSDCRCIVLQARVLTDPGAVMVLDRKGRLVYVTEKLGMMLGYPVQSLVKMELTSLLPQPYCQMHSTWFKDLTKKNNPTSCRAGAVVHLLAANGVKVPVTLKMLQKEAHGSAGGLLHVVYVTRASEGQRLDQTRLLLSLNHKGTVLEVNSGAPKSLFGFTVTELIGRPLASIIDAFGVWRHEFGEDDSLLMMLSLQALKEGATGMTAAKSDSGIHASGASWRVGVHQPVKDEEIAAHAANLADQRKVDKGGFGQGGTSSLLHALQQQRRLHAACMSLEVLERDDRELTDDSAAAETIPVFQVSLYRSDSLTATVELGKNMTITRIDGAIGLMLGVSTRTLVKRNFPRLIGLPPSTTFGELLGTKAPVVKKGAMRRSAAGGPPAAGTSRMGVARTVTAKHLGDGKDLQMEIQAMSYEANGKVRYMVRVQLRDASNASIEALLQLRKEGQVAGAVDAVRAALLEAEEASGAGQGLVAVSDGEEEAPEERHQGANNHHAAPDDPGSFNRTSDWVREASSQGGARSPPGSPPRRGEGRERSPVPSPDPRGRKGSNTGRFSSQEGYDSGYDPGQEPTAIVQIKARGAAVRKDALLDDVFENKVLDNFSKQGPGSAAGSSAQGSSANDGVSETGGQSVTSGADMGHDEELAVDSRRAKRLKKLSRMLHSSLAQVDTNRWRLHTLGLLAIILVAHVICFVVLTTQIDRRYKNANNVAMMTRGLARMQLITLRANFIQKCKNPFFKGMFACSASNQQSYRSSLHVSCDLAADAHQTLYLGASGINPFADKRLLDYWTYKQLPEHIFYPTYSGPNGTTQTNVVLEGSRPLWEMGNVLVSAGRDLYFQSDKLGMEMNITAIWQYVFQNGPDSIFKGYAWSLDTYVDYAWRDLLSLAVLLIILLVVEALVVQMGCMAYEFRLIQQCNASHMRLFSVFLALPSATIRIMTQRQLQVDDDTRDEMDEDDYELGDAAVVAATGTTNQAGEKAPNKSVHMEVSDELEAEGKPSKGRKDGRDSKGGRDGKESKRAKHDGESDAASDDDLGSPSRTSRKGASSSKSSSKKPPVTSLEAFRKSTYKRVLGWLDPKFKMNGKKMIANSAMVWRFMVPLLLWVCSVIVIFATSYRNLQGLQGPLASLDTVSHVLYRATRCRLFSCMVAFSVDPSEDTRWRNMLKQELTDLRTEYNTLMYGGPMMLQANVTFKAVAPASSFADSKITNLFFRTTDCLRIDKSGCHNDPADPFYQITHTGLDAQINRYMDEMTRFASLPINESLANASSYEFAMKVTAYDTYDGLNTAGDLFVAWTISRFASVKQLHVILLVISLALMVGFVLMLYRPYIKRLKRDSKMVAGMLSQLPAEVDVEGQVKQVVLGMVKGDGARSADNSFLVGGAPGLMPPGGMPPGAGNMFSSVPGMGSALMVPPGPNMGGSMPGYMPGMQNGGEPWSGRGAGPRWSAGGYDNTERFDRGPPQGYGRGPPQGYGRGSPQEYGRGPPQEYGRGPPQGRGPMGYNKNAAIGGYDDEV